MVLQVLPDAGQVDDDGDPERASSSALPIPESISSLGESIGTRADDDLVLGTDLLGCPLARDSSTPTQRPPSMIRRRRARAGEEGQVGCVEHGRAGTRRPGSGGSAVLDRSGGRSATPSWVAPLWSVLKGMPDLLRRLNGRGEERMRLVGGGHTQRTAGAVVLGCPAAEVLGALEERQDVVVAPARAAKLGPAVVVAAMAADVDHPVQRARAAEHLAAWDVDLADRRSRAAGRCVYAQSSGAAPELAEPLQGRGSPGSRRGRRPR